MKHTHYVRQNPLFCMYRNHRYNFKKYFEGKRILEVGPNKGSLFEKYYPLVDSYMLLEPNAKFEPDFIKLQQRHPNVQYEINGFEAFAPSERFDVIVMMAVIAHIRLGTDKLFAKIDSLLESGGILIIETNNTKRNLGLLKTCDENYERLEAKTTYGGLMKWLKIDYREVFVYRKSGR